MSTFSPHPQHNERVQLQRLILQRQGAVEGHYNVHPGLSLSQRGTR